MKFSIALSAILLATTAHAASLEVRRGGAGAGAFGGAGAGAAAGAAANKGGAGAAANKGGAAAAASASAASVAAAAATATDASAAAATAASAANAGGNNASNATATASSGDLQSSTTLDPAVIATGFAQNGQENTTEAGQVPSLTSTNNFINFCAIGNLPITNGLQIKTGSCNPAPMGIIAAQTVMPASKFVNPKNLDDLPANTAFTITMAIKNLEAGNFVNAQANYYSAPQQVNAQGQIIGHSHFVIEALDSLTQTTPLNNQVFSFFQGVNTAADANGNLNVQVTAGLPAGTYRLASINAAANHQPALVAVAQHGSLDDMVYFTVGGSNSTAAAAGAGAAAGAAASNSTAAAAGAAASDAATASAAGAAGAASTAAAGKGAGAGAAAGNAAAGKAGAAGAAAAGKAGAAGATGNAAAAAAAKKGKNRFAGFNRSGLNRL